MGGFIEVVGKALLYFGVPGVCLTVGGLIAWTVISSAFEKKDD